VSMWAIMKENELVDQRGPTEKISFFSIRPNLLALQCTSFEKPCFNLKHVRLTEAAIRRR
jgi:hypothetical protein